MHLVAGGIEGSQGFKFGAFPPALWTQIDSLRVVALVQTHQTRWDRPPYGGATLEVMIIHNRGDTTRRSGMLVLQQHRGVVVASAEKICYIFGELIKRLFFSFNFYVRQCRPSSGGTYLPWGGAP